MSMQTTRLPGIEASKYRANDPQWPLSLVRPRKNTHVFGVFNTIAATPACGAVFVRRAAAATWRYRRPHGQENRAAFDVAAIPSAAGVLSAD